MKIRFVGLLTEAQVAKGLAGYKTIEPAEGIFIKGGLTYTFTFKKKVAVGVTIRRAPRITLLDETDAETPAPETSFDEKYASFGGEHTRVVRVRSEAEAKELLEMATEAGYKWYSGGELLLDISFEDYGYQTAYWFEAETKRVQYSDVEWCKEQGAEVIEFEPEPVESFKVGDRVVTANVSSLVANIFNLNNGLRGMIESLEEVKGDKLATVVWDAHQNADKLPSNKKYGKIKGEILLEHLKKVAN